MFNLYLSRWNPAVLLAVRASRKLLEGVGT